MICTSPAPASCFPKRIQGTGNTCHPFFARSMQPFARAKLQLSVQLALQFLVPPAHLPELRTRGALSGQFDTASCIGLSRKLTTYPPLSESPVKKECADFRHQAVRKLQALPSGFAWKSVLRCLLGVRVLLVDMLEKVLEQIHSDVTILAAGVTPERSPTFVR